MSHLVIARKWRPKLFEEVVGQEHVVRTLTNAIASGRVGHAYIFSGPRGVGKTTVARILAKCLNCEEGPTSTPCNKCASCKGITSGVSVDVLEIDGASNTGVDNIRELRENVRYAPSSSRHKVYIIDEVHMLSTAAFNALLKTLEEPPPHVVFIFATTEPHKIPLTIHSRCQSFDFRRIPTSKLHDHLSLIAGEEGVDIDDEALYMLAREGQGSLRDSQSLLEQVMAFAGKKVTKAQVIDVLGVMDRTIISELISAVIEKNSEKCLKIVERIHDFGYDLKKVSVELLEVVRDLAVVKVTSKDSGEEKPRLIDLPDAEVEKLEELSSKVSLDTVQLIFGILGRGYEEVVRAPTPRYSLEMALLRAVSVEDVRPLPEVLSRLEALRSAIGAGGGAGGGRGGSAAGGKGIKAGGSIAAGVAEATGTPYGRKTSQGSTGASQNKVTRKKDAATDKEVTADIDIKSKETGPKDSRPKDSYTGDAGTEKTVPAFLAFLREKSTTLFRAVKADSVEKEASTLTLTATEEGSVSFLNARRLTLVELATEFFGTRTNVSILGTDGKGGGRANAPKAASKGDTGGLGSSEAVEGSEAGTARAPDRGSAGASTDNDGVHNTKTKTDPLIKQALKVFEGKVIEERRRSNV